MSYYVKDYMDKEFPTLEIEASVVDAAKLLVAKNKGYVIVLEKGKPYGIVTEFDLVTKILAAEKDPKRMVLKQIASTPLISIDPDEDLLKASELMQAKGIKRVAGRKAGCHLRCDHRDEYRPEMRGLREQVCQGRSAVVLPHDLVRFKSQAP